MKKTLLVLGLLVCAVGLSACGKKGSLEIPADADPSYPRTYPAPATPPSGDPGDRP